MEVAPEEIRQKERLARVILSAFLAGCLMFLVSVIEIDEISDPADEISFSAFNWLFAPPDTPILNNSDAGVILLNEKSLESLKGTSKNTRLTQSWPI